MAERMKQVSKQLLTRVFNDYGRKYGILKENDKNLSGDDVREGLVAVVSVKLTDAQFEGQTKGKLGNTDMGQMVSQMIYEKLMTFFEENPAVIKAIYAKALVLRVPVKQRVGADPCAPEICSGGKFPSR